MVAVGRKVASRKVSNIVDTGGRWYTSYLIDMTTDGRSTKAPTCTS